MKAIRWTTTLLLGAALCAPALSGAEPSLTVGKQLYDSSCVACHGTGAMGAPELGDRTAWAPYVAAGFESMVEAAVHGKGAMPARGGTKADDASVRAAVEYILSASQ